MDEVEWNGPNEEEVDDVGEDGGGLWRLEGGRGWWWRMEVEEDGWTWNGGWWSEEAPTHPPSLASRGWLLLPSSRSIDRSIDDRPSPNSNILLDDQSKKEEEEEEASSMQHRAS